MTHARLEFPPGVARLLDRYAPVIDAPPEWEDVLRRAGLEAAPARGRRVWFAIAVAAAVAVTLALATPLGGAIRDGVEGFTAWLRGTPGEPVGANEQRAFEEENARSYVSFPGSPQLRRLTRAELDGVTYDLLGFRTAAKLCVRIVAAGAAAGSTTLCAPIDDLRRDDAPVRVVVVDWGVGRSEKKETIGFDTYHAPLARVTAGIAADGVKAVELVDDGGSHRVDVVANSFLYVAPKPDVAQLVTHVRAQLDNGRTVGVPFTPLAWGPGGGFAASAGEPGGPTRVERTLDGGTIRWLERREPRGEPLASVPQSLRMGDAEFGRVIAPDPESEKRVAVTVGPMAFRGAGGATSVCYTLITRGGAGGGCAGKPDELFKNVPFTFGYSVMGVGDQYATFSGLASDDVARLELFTAKADRIPVALRDNTFLAEVALARLPAKMVAYDHEGRVVGIQETPREDGPQTPVGEPIVRLAARVDDSSFTLIAHRTKQGGQCWFGRGTGDAHVNTGSCIGNEWRIAPVRLMTIPEPPAFVYGRVRDDVKRVEIRFTDGKPLEIEPGRYGYVLLELPAEYRAAHARVTDLIGYDERGEIVGRVRMPPHAR